MGVDINTVFFGCNHPVMFNDTFVATEYHTLMTDPFVPIPNQHVCGDVGYRDGLHVVPKLHQNRGIVG